MLRMLRALVLLGLVALAHGIAGSSHQPEWSIERVHVFNDGHQPLSAIEPAALFEAAPHHRRVLAGTSG